MAYLLNSNAHSHHNTWTFAFFVVGLLLSKQKAPSQLTEVGCTFWLFCERVARAEHFQQSMWSAFARVCTCSMQN